MKATRTWVVGAEKWSALGWNREKKQPFTELRETERGTGFGINNSSVLDVLILIMLIEYPNEMSIRQADLESLYVRGNS